MHGPFPSNDPLNQWEVLPSTERVAEFPELRELDTLIASGRIERVPRWIVEPLLNFVGDSIARGRFLALVSRSLIAAGLNPSALDVEASLARLDNGDDPPPLGETISSTLPDYSDRILSEVSSEFATMGAYNAVALWSALTVAVEDFVGALAVRQSHLIDPEVRSRLTVPLDFLTWDPTDQATHLVDEFRRHLQRSRGLTIFEALLDKVGLSGPVDEPVKRGLLTISEVRNVIVHRRGRADKRLVSTYPWLGYGLGDQVRVPLSTLRSWDAIATSYVVLILSRATERLPGRLETP